MTDLLDTVDLDLNQVRVIVQAMVRVAHADGAHERELVLIREFYEACRNDVRGLADFQDIQRAPFDAVIARESITTEALQQTLLASCYLVAYADGEVSDGELTAIDEIAGELGIGADTLAKSRERIKDLLVMQLARGASVESLQKLTAGL